MGEESESEIIFELARSGKKSIFRNEHKITIFSIRSGTKIFPADFQHAGPRNSRSQARNTYDEPIIYVLFEGKITDPLSLGLFSQVFHDF